MLELLLDNPNFGAINKPAKLAVIPGRAEETSVLEQLAEQLNLPHSGTADPRLRVVHRLDKDTTGVLLFAKNIDTRAAIFPINSRTISDPVRPLYLALAASA